MNHIRFSKLLYVVLLFALVACQAAAQPPAVPLLNPGDIINGMTLTIGAAEAPPIWAFCSPALESHGVTTVECRVPPLSKLAIGHTFKAADEALKESSWSALTWELYLDDHPVDLDAFGTYDFHLPSLSYGPSTIREVMRKVTDWDVVLTFPKRGAHRLRGLVLAKANTYTWIVNFTVEAEGPSVTYLQK